MCQYDPMTLYCEVSNNIDSILWFQPNDTNPIAFTTAAPSCILSSGSRPYISCSFNLAQPPFHVNLTFTNSSIAEGDNGLWTCTQISSKSKNITLDCKFWYF